MISHELEVLAAVLHSLTRAVMAAPMSLSAVPAATVIITEVQPPQTEALAQVLHQQAQ